MRPLPRPIRLPQPTQIPQRSIATEPYQLSRLVLELDGNPDLARSWDGKHVPRLRKTRRPQPATLNFTPMTTPSPIMLMDLALGVKPLQKGSRSQRALAQLHATQHIPLETPTTKIMRDIYQPVDAINRSHLDELKTKLKACDDINDLAYIVSRIARSAEGQDLINDELQPLIVDAVNRARFESNAHSPAIVRFLSNLEANMQTQHRALGSQLCSLGLTYAATPYGLPAAKHYIRLITERGYTDTQKYRDAMAKLGRIVKGKQPGPRERIVAKSQARRAILELLTGWEKGAPGLREARKPCFRTIIGVDPRKSEKAYLHYVALLAEMNGRAALWWEWEDYVRQVAASGPSSKIAEAFENGLRRCGDAKHADVVLRTK